jgi:hypothetical protein
MSNKKEDKPMGLVAVVEDTGFINMREQLAPKQVKAYTEARVQRGDVEYNNGSILAKSRHPLDQCLKRSIIEQEHYDIGNSFRTIRDCAFSRLHGRIYNDTGEGDSGIDAATLYANTWRRMTRNQWKLIALICFAEPQPNGEYFSEVDYQYLYRLAPNLQSALEALNKAFVEARKAIKTAIENEKKRLEEGVAKRGE